MHLSDINKERHHAESLRGISVERGPVTLTHHAAALAAYYQAARPASVLANPKILAWSIFGNLLGALLSLETVWRMGSELIEDPLPRWYPVTVQRVRMLMSALAVALYIGPDAVVFMAWPDVQPQTRYLMALSNRVLDGVAVWLFVAGSVLGKYSARTIDHQLRREPLPNDLWLAIPDLRRALWTGLLVLLVSLALSYGR